MRDALARLATGRSTSAYAADVATHAGALADTFGGRRVLVIGGAGSIGAATIRALLPYRPSCVDVIDQSENGLAELVRDVRSDDLVDAGTAFRLMPLDYGASVALRFIGSTRYDAVLHFAALKHVRSEKDVASVLQMLDTNVLKQRRLMAWLADIGVPAHYFAVSTDKAANPVNFMGASKRLMEHLLFTPGATPLAGDRRTAARFANVAFSAGSLLASWRDRIANGQPVAVPRDTRRYFVSLAESAEICLLAAGALPHAHLAVPRMTAAADLHDLVAVAEAFIRASGFTPVRYEEPGAARAAVEPARTAGQWPLLLTPRDTTGEKAEEEFVGTGERAIEAGMKALQAVPQAGIDRSALQDALDHLETWVAQPRLAVGLRDLADVIRGVVPEFAHAASDKSLDDRI
jgi:FlaA1/EpsC-like NDP-sugar epimerase